MTTATTTTTTATEVRVWDAASSGSTAPCPRSSPKTFPIGWTASGQAAGFSWRGLARELRVNARTVRRWKVGAGVGSGHLVSLFALTAGLGLLHHLLPEVGEPVGAGSVAIQD